MAQKKINLSRRSFLRKTAVVGAGAWAAPYFSRRAFAASRDRVTIYGLGPF